LRHIVTVCTDGLGIVHERTLAILLSHMSDYSIADSSKRDAATKGHSKAGVGGTTLVLPAVHACEAARHLRSLTIGEDTAFASVCGHSILTYGRNPNAKDQSHHYENSL
jgi:hypothetical protein